MIEHLKGCLLMAAFFICSNSHAALKIEGYVQKYLKANPSLSQAGQDYRQAKLSAASSASWWNTELSLTPSYTNYDSSTLGQYNTTTADLSLSQSLKWATTLSVTASQSRLSSAPSEDPWSLGFRIDQPLGRNFLGRQDWLTYSAAENLSKAAQQSFRAKTISVCFDGILLYSSMYKQLQEEKIHLEVTSIAERVQKILSGLYRRKLITRIEVLSSQADILRVRQSSEKAAAQKLSTLSSFLKNAGLSNLDSLQSPDAVFESLSAKATSLKAAESPSLLSQKYKLESQKQTLSRIQKDAGLDLSLYIATTRSRSALSSFSSTAVDTDTAEVGLTVALPLYKPSSQYATEIETAKMISAQKKLDELKLKHEIDKASLQAQLKALKKQISQTKSVIEVYKKQTDEAYRLLKQGRMEIDDYLRYRDRYYNEQISLLEKKYSYQKNLSRFLAENGFHPGICRNTP
jgi:outer membrane protein TolC